MTEDKLDDPEDDDQVKPRPHEKGELPGLHGQTITLLQEHGLDTTDYFGLRIKGRQGSEWTSLEPAPARTLPSPSSRPM